MQNKVTKMHSQAVWWHHTCLRQDNKVVMFLFFKIKHPAFTFRLARDLEGAVGVRSEAEYLTSINNSLFLQCLKGKWGLSWLPCAHCPVLLWWARACSTLQEHKDVSGTHLSSPAFQLGLCSLDLERRRGLPPPPDLPAPLGALLYPPLPNRAGAAPWDLTNPLLFQVPRVLAALLIPPALFSLWLLMLCCLGLCVPRDFYPFLLFLGAIRQICPNGAYIHASPLT